MRVVQPQALDERQSAERAVVHGEIDDDDVGLLAPVEPEAFRQALRLNDAFHASEFQQLPAAFQDDRMIVDDKHLH